MTYLYPALAALLTLGGAWIVLRLICRREDQITEEHLAPEHELSPHAQTILTLRDQAFHIEF